MSPEVKRHAPKRELITRKEWLPPTLVDAIGSYVFKMGRFSSDASATVYIKSVPTAAYIGQVGDGRIVLNLIVLEQVRLNVDGVRSVNWRYGSYEGTPLREVLSKGTKFEQQTANRLITRKPTITSRAKLKDRILANVRRYTG